MAGIAVEPGTVEQGVARLGGGRLARLAAVALEHVLHLVFDHVQGLDHVADALAAEILEIAGFVDFHHVFLNFLREAALVIVFQRGGKRPGALVVVQFEVTQ